MENRELKINSFINKGVIEANIEFSKHHNSPLSIVKFGYDVDFDDSFLFKDMISFIHSYTDFSSILLQSSDTFIIFLRDCKIHEAKSTITQMMQNIKYKFNIEIKQIGITLLDKEDSYKTLLDRLDKYYVMSKLSTKKKTFYGTLDFDFYETQNDKKVLSNIFIKSDSIKLFNFYQGLPITEKVKVLKFSQGVMLIKVDPLKISFYNNEDFTFIQHDLIASIIKASIKKIDTINSLITLNNFQFLDSSPVERSSIRVEPEREIHAALSKENSEILNGDLISISENSVVLHAQPEDIQEINGKSIWNRVLVLQFHVPTAKSFLATIKTDATLYSILDDKIVLNITPNKLIKSKLRNYISLRQNSVLIGLKQEMKKTTRSIR